MSVKTHFLGVELANPLMNASGVHCMTRAEMDQLAASAAGAFVTKTATRDARKGNPEPRYVDVPLGSINSMGLPNRGLAYYLDYCLARQDQVSLQFLSVVGLSYDEIIDNLRTIQSSAYQGVTEFNLSCPNVPGKPQIAYDFELTERLLTEVSSFFTKPLGLKLPPYFDIAHFDQMAAILNRFPLAYVNCVNSIGNGLYIDVAQEQVVIKPKGGFGGIGGDYIKPTALANIRAFSKRLKPSIKIIGTGGVRTGQDVFEHILCGASLVQVGTALHQEGVGIFDRLVQELEVLMASKGYTCLEDFRGQLREIEEG